MQPLVGFEAMLVDLQGADLGVQRLRALLRRRSSYCCAFIDQLMRLSRRRPYGLSSFWALMYHSGIPLPRVSGQRPLPSSANGRPTWTSSMHPKTALFYATLRLSDRLLRVIFPGTPVSFHD